MDNDPLSSPAIEPVSEGGGIHGATHDTSPSLHRLERGTMLAFAVISLLLLMLLGFSVGGYALYRQAQQQHQQQVDQEAAVAQQARDRACNQAALQARSNITATDIHLLDTAIKSLQQSFSAVLDSKLSPTEKKLVLQNTTQTLATVEAARAQDDKARAEHPLSPC